MKPQVPAILAGLCCVVRFASAQDFERIAPKQPVLAPRTLPSSASPMRAAGDERVLVESLRGVVLVNSPERISKSGLEGVTNVQFREVSAPAPEDLQKCIAAHLGQPVSLASLSRLQRDIMEHYRRHDHPLVNVVAPEQDITSGVVQLIVIEGKLGSVTAEGQKWFSGTFLESQIRLRPSEPVSGQMLNQDLDWLNNNPFRRVEAVYRPGAQPGTTDLALQTRDRFPVRFFVGYEDTGSALTDEERWLAGFNWGNAFGLDHQLSYQFTGSFDLEKLRAHSAVYAIPLPWRHTLTLFGAYADSSLDTAGAAVEGFSWQTGARYVAPLPDLGPVRHSLAAGFEFKRSNNNLNFGGALVFATETDVLQWLLAYDATLRDRWGATTLNGTIFYSPGGLTDGNEDAAFLSQRSFADSRYVYGRASLERVTRLPAEFSLVTKALWQWADGNLLASEQLGAGGWSTVRGYDEREARGDEGGLFSVELRTPPISPLGLLLRSKNALASQAVGDQLQFLAFWDYGVVKIKDPLPGEDDSVELSGVGAGFHYNLAPFVAVRFDYGWQLKDTGFNRNYNSRAHVGIVISY